MSYTYDEQNIFAKILRKEIPNKTVAETEHCLAFHDINPAAPVHVLIIPKGPYVAFDHFAAEASDAEIIEFNRLAAQLCRELDLSPGSEKNGYRVISNAGLHGVQEVPHYHLHLIGGAPLGRMIQPRG